LRGAGRLSNKFNKILRFFDPLQKDVYNSLIFYLTALAESEWRIQVCGPNKQGLPQMAITEKQLNIPTLRAAASMPNGFIPTTMLISTLEHNFGPSGSDAQILNGRNDTKFSQKVRNLISHRNTSSSIFSRGLAVYDPVRAGIYVTSAGKKLIGH
jgi:hypothetical protein